MMGWMIVGVIGYCAAVALAFHLLVTDYRQFRKGIGSRLTNGDVVFCAIIAVLPFGLPVALLVTAIDGYGQKGSEWAERPFDRE